MSTSSSGSPRWITSRSARSISCWPVTSPTCGRGARRPAPGSSRASASLTRRKRRSRSRNAMPSGESRKTASSSARWRSVAAAGSRREVERARELRRLRRAGLRQARGEPARAELAGEALEPVDGRDDRPHRGERQHPDQDQQDREPAGGDPVARVRRRWLSARRASCCARLAAAKSRARPGTRPGARPSGCAAYSVRRRLISCACGRGPPAASGSRFSARRGRRHLHARPLAAPSPWARSRARTRAAPAPPPG